MFALRFSLGKILVILVSFLLGLKQVILPPLISVKVSLLMLLFFPRIIAKCLIRLLLVVGFSILSILMSRNALMVLSKSGLALTVTLTGFLRWVYLMIFLSQVILLSLILCLSSL